MTALTSGLRGRLSAFVVAVAVALGLAVTAGSQTAHAGNRDFLRADNSGTCVWDPVAYWVQRCDVWSQAMNRNIAVQVQPATNGGNAGLYLLDGLRATEETNAWVNDVNAAATYAGSNITLAMPIGGAASFYANWDGPAKYDLHDPVDYQWETFLTSELPGYLEANFGVARNNNSIAGLSMGGTAALTLAGKHPDQFRQALSFSGYLTTTLPGVQTMIRLAMLDAGGYNINAMYGSVIDPRRFQNDPLFQTSGLKNTDVYISAGSGIAGPGDEGYLPEHKVTGAALETIAMVTTRAWEAKARGDGLTQITADYPAQGLHNWVQFGSQLEKTKGRVLDVMNAW